jgi:hypothetical protein
MKPPEFYLAMVTLISGSILSAISLGVGAQMCHLENDYWPFVLHGPVAIMVLAVVIIKTVKAFKDTNQ